jgi:hypothetical protein
VYLYRAVDSTGATIDFLLSSKRDAAAAERFLAKATSQIIRPSACVCRDGQRTAVATKLHMAIRRLTVFSVRTMRWPISRRRPFHFGRPVAVNDREFLGFVYYFTQLKSHAEIPVDRGLLLRSAAML